MSIEGTDGLLKKIDALENVSGGAMRKMVAKQALMVKDDAKLRCPVKRFGSGGGALRQSIHSYSKATEDGAIGVVYTNSIYAPPVEFGTGPVGQENHKNIAPGINPVYSQTGWMIPGDAMDEDTAEEYGFGIARGKDGEVLGYYTNGQPAQPFMYPALRDNQDTILKNIKTELIVNIRKAIK